MGRIITFYSYKGGVGRTFGLANIAVLLARAGKRVLAIDWDLEAPGLDRYFEQLPTNGPVRTKGLVHLLDQSSRGSSRTNWQNYVTTLGIDGGLPVSLISSGHKSNDYADLMRSFSWQEYFGQQNGSEILDRWRDEWKSQFDFVLMDSRTGITDAGGVCTVFMPDLLVLVFSANNQSFAGGLHIVEGVQISRRELNVARPPLTVLPLPGKFDGRDEIGDARIWMEKFAIELKPYYDDWLPKQYHPRRMLELTKIPYISKFSFGEPLPVLSDSITDPELPGFYLNNAARLIATDFADAANILAPSDSIPVLIAQFRSAIDDDGIGDDTYNALFERFTLLLEGTSLCTLLNEITIILEQYNQYDLVEQNIRRTVEIERASLDMDNAVYLATLEMMKSNVSFMFDLNEAENLFREYIERLLRLRGSQNPLLTRARSDLGEILWQQGRITEAEEEYSSALAAMRKLGEPSDIVFIGVLNDLGQIKHELGNLDAAEVLHREALSKLRASSRIDERLLDRTCDFLASTFKDKGDFESAASLYREVLQRIKASDTEPGTTRVLNAYRHLAETFRSQGDLLSSEALYSELVEKIRSASKVNEPALVRAINLLASVLQDKGDFVGAEQLYRQALATRTSPNRINQPTMESFAALLELTYRRGDLTDARRLVEANILLVNRILKLTQKSFQPVQEIMRELGYTRDSDGPELF